VFWRGPGWSALRALRALTLASAALAAVPACEDDTPVQRGFGSRQIAHLRETNFTFEGGRGDFVLYAIGTVPADSRYFSIDVTTGTVREHDPLYSDVPLPPQANLSPDLRFHCRYGTGPMGETQFWIDDTQTGQRKAFEAPSLVGACPTESDPTFKVWQRDASGYLILSTGPWDALQPAPIDLDVLQVTQIFRSTDTSVKVFGSRPAAPDALGVFAIDMSSFAVTELVSPALQGGAWADGATGAGALDSASLFPNPGEGWSGVGTIGDHFRYWRAMAGGGETLFVGPFPSAPARELAVFQRDGSAPAYIVSTVRVNSMGGPTPTTWQRRSTDGPHEFLIWDDVGRRLVTCPSGFATMEPLGAVSPDGSKLLLFLMPTRDSYALEGATGPLQLVDMADPGAGSAPCRTLASEKISFAGFSPDGAALFWLVQPEYPSTAAELWLAAADGTAPRLIGTDGISGPPNPPRFVGESRLQLQIDNDLVWLDIHDDPIRTHAIVEHVLGNPIGRGRWLIVGYNASDADGTARLGVVNRDDGADKRLISPDVSDYMSPDISAYDGAFYQVIPGPRTAGDPIRVVYLVRGRNPSAQDGLWVATINASDIP
jgi:hypothetical protein